MGSSTLKIGSSEGWMPPGGVTGTRSRLRGCGTQCVPGCDVEFDDEGRVVSITCFTIVEPDATLPPPRYETRHHPEYYQGGSGIRKRIAGRARFGRRPDACQDAQRNVEG